MQDWYQMPVLVLTTLLLPAFGYLYFRTRDTRNLLWFLAFIGVDFRLFLVPGATWEAATGPAWATAVGQACAMLASGLFLGSLSPLYFRIGKVRVLYVIPYIVPLIGYALLSRLISPGSASHGILFWVFPGLGSISLVAGLRWSRVRGTLPIWAGMLICVVFSGLAFWCYFARGVYWPLILAESGNHVVTALLVVSVFRRISPGVFLSVLGFLLWSLPVLLLYPQFYAPALHLLLLRSVMLGRLVAALGLILLMLENELAVNIAASRRDRRVRREMEAYAALVLSRRRLEDFDRQAEEICGRVAESSRFKQAALLLHSNGRYRVAGSAGIDSAVVKSLNDLAGRIPVADFLALSPPVAGGPTVTLDLHPWLQPGDDLERLHFTSALAVPLRGRSAIEGAFLLSGLRSPDEPLRPDDLVPLEMLAARMQSVRSQTRMLEKLIDSEKFAGIGQLAGNVAQQLNNPLTVILGYAGLLEENLRLDAQDRKGVEAILASARSMRSTLESLQRVARSPGNQLTVVSIAEMLTDMERLHRSEFIQRSIELRVHIAPELPPVRAHAQQLRQAVLHCLQFAMDTVENMEDESDKLVRLEAAAEGNHVQILIAHNGPGFEQPERAFDPFVPAQAAGDIAGLGLSLCATILRDNQGVASAVNLEPRGAAIVLELQAA